jgi:hypothetical protein
MLKTHVEFKSDKFPPYDMEEDEVNLGRWGKCLAEYMASKLKTNGVSVGNTYPEDWGWAIPVEGKSVSMWIGCGNYEEYSNGFLCFIEPSKPIVKKWFKKVDISDEIKLLHNVIDQILKSDDDIMDVKWWSENEK